MQAVRTLVLQHLRLRAQPSVTAAAHGGGGRAAVAQCGFARGMSAPASQEAGDSDSESAIRARVVKLVKKFDKIDADKGTAVENTS